MYIQCSEDVLDVFWKLCVRPIYALCPGGVEIGAGVGENEGEHFLPEGQGASWDSGSHYKSKQNNSSVSIITSHAPLLKKFYQNYASKISLTKIRIGN